MLASLASASLRPIVGSSACGWSVEPYG